MKIPLRRLIGVFGCACVVATGLVSQPADAFKPNTHNQIGFDAYADAIDDGRVTINGRSYPIPERARLALQQYPSYYNAGVIGPDGFPDLTMGQSVVHPKDTGRWFDHLLRAAWDAQGPGAGPAGGAPYTEQEKLQSLAFAYGFLTHGAGDLWAHTMINELSGDIFPGVSEILTEKSKAEIAIRHILLEGYVGAATVGADKNPEESVLPNGDVADDASPRIPFDAPGRFIYDTLVRRGNAAAPSDERGPAINFFIDLRAELAAFVTASPQPVQAALDSFNATVDGIKGAFRAGGVCTFGTDQGNAADAVLDAIADTIACPLKLGAAIAIGTFSAATAFLGESLKLAAKPLLNAYVNAWIKDIDEGLVAWHELGLATTKALFDPQTQRDAENLICRNDGPDIVTAAPAGSDPNVRRNCETGVGPVETVLFASNDFINNHLLAMLGLPDFVGGLREALQDVSGLIDDAIGPAFNPIKFVSNELEQYAKDLIIDFVSDRFGIDIELIEEQFTNPTTRIDVQTLPLGPFGTLNLLGPSVRAKLDRYLGLASHAPFTPLADNEVFSAARFNPYGNGVTLSKLLLLDGAGLDAVMTDLVGHPYSLYNAGSIEANRRVNVMTKTFPGIGDQTQWLTLIDGDHGWRSDGAPKFGPTPHGGSGNLPLYESCILRNRGFRSLFRDWENDDTPGIGNSNGVLDPAENFPDLGDATSTDPNDPLPPSSAIAVGTPTIIDAGVTWVTGATPLTLNASDDFWSPAEISVALTVAGATVTRATGQAFNLAGQPDGPVAVTHQPSDDCRTGNLIIASFTVDNTPPTVTVTAPVADPPPYSTDALVPVTATSNDATGVGVDNATFEVRLDSALVSDTFTIDTYLLNAGLHDLTVSVADRLGNIGKKSVTFRVRATSQSLYNNVQRAFAEGKITNRGTLNGLSATISAAIRSHSVGKHPVETNQLGAARNILSQASGRSVDPAVAQRLVGYIDDLIASQG
jgi:hypothetical protein